MQLRDVRELRFNNLPYGEHLLSAWVRHGGVRSRHSSVCIHVVPVHHSAPEGFSVCILVHRGSRSFRRAFASWVHSGLLARAHEVLLYLQQSEWCGSRTPQPLPCADPRVGFLQQYRIDRVRVMGSKEQVGIGPAMLELVRSAHGAHVLFLEEDFAIRDDHRVRVPSVLGRGMELLRRGEVELLRLRSATHPGVPFYPSVWRGREHQLAHKLTPYNSHHTYLEARTWLNATAIARLLHPHVWPCAGRGEGEGAAQSRMHADRRWAREARRGETMCCARSSHAGWSNNPILASKAFLLHVLHEVARRDWTRRLEGAINNAPHLWSERGYRIAQGRGLFTHSDVDGRGLAEQSPYEDPFHGDWLRKRERQYYLETW